MTLSASDLPPIQTLDEFEVETTAMMTRPFVSKFGAVPWQSIMAPGPEHKWLVKGLLTEGELSMLAGASQSGKSFLTIDLAMSIARGIDWMGRKVSPGGVIYQAGEGASGLRRRRIPAYMKHYGVTPDDDVPFVFMPGKVNLWDGTANTDEMIAEIQHWASQMTVPLKLVIIDTLAKAMTGGDEISGKDMGMVIERCDRIRRATGTAVLLVHHMNAGGEKVRGHTSVIANLDSVLICKMAMTPGGRGQEETAITDSDGRKIREIAIGKSKDSDTNVKPFRFVLRAIEIGRDEDDEPVTSCIVAPPSGEEIESRSSNGPPRVSVKLSLAMKALAAAIAMNGRPAPSHVPNAPSGSNCTTLTDWRDQFAPMIAEENEDPEKLKERAKKARDRAIEALIDRNYIRKHGDWVWRTGKTIPGIDRPEPEPKWAPPANPQASTAPDDLDDLPF